MGMTRPVAFKPMDFDIAIQSFPIDFKSGVLEIGSGFNIPVPPEEDDKSPAIPQTQRNIPRNTVPSSLQQPFIGRTGFRASQ